MTQLHAQPFDIDATGFYFTDADDYAAKAAACRNAYGQPVEEFEIQFIDGAGIDAALFNALHIHQGSIAAFYDAVEYWSDDEKIRVIIAVGEGGHTFDVKTDDPEDIEIDIYECESLRELAMQFVDDGLFGEIPAAIANYLDYDAIAYDLSMDYSEAVIDGARYVYRLA